MRKGQRTGIYEKCLACPNQVYSRPSRKQKYCSLVCRDKNWSEWVQSRRGKKNKFWKGGRAYIGKYVYVKAYEHPYRNSGNYMAEHRLEMEKKIGRYLTANEEVHHVNGIKDDNRITNLEIVLKNAHFGKITCPHCQKPFKIK